MKRRRPLTEEQRAARRAQERELTERAIAQLRSSAGWQAWLAVRARTGLRRYSVRNQLLVAFQDPHATRVAGFRAWLALGLRIYERKSRYPTAQTVTRQAARIGTPKRANCAPV
jgi:hypothetical protein